MQTTSIQPTLTFNSIEIGTLIPTLVKEPGPVQLFAFGAATWDTHRTHYDAEYAKEVDHLPGILVHGHLQAAFLCQMVNDWAGPRALIKRINYQNRGMAIPGDRLTCMGKVSSKEERDGQRIVFCDVWVENQKGEKPTTGEITVTFPPDD